MSRFAPLDRLLPYQQGACRIPTAQRSERPFEAPRGPVPIWGHGARALKSKRTEIRQPEKGLQPHQTQWRIGRLPAMPHKVVRNGGVPVEGVFMYRFKWAADIDF